MRDDQAYESDMSPDDGEVLQEEGVPAARLECVPVVVEGPVRTQQLPAKASGMRRYTVGTTVAERVAAADPRRRSLQLQAYNADGTATGVFIAGTKNQAELTGARLALLAGAGTAVASPLLPLAATDEVWVKAEGAEVEVSVFGEQWAE